MKWRNRKGLDRRNVCGVQGRQTKKEKNENQIEKKRKKEIAGKKQIQWKKESKSMKERKEIDEKKERRKSM